MSPPSEPQGPQAPRGPIPVHQALTADELLGVLPGDAPMEPGLGAVDGCGEMGVRLGGNPHLGQGPPSLSTTRLCWMGPCGWALLTGAERGALAGCRQAVAVRCLLLTVQSKERALGWARGGGHTPPLHPCTPTYPPGLRLLQGHRQHLTGVLDHPARAPREVHGHQCVVRDASLRGSRG